MSYFLKVTEPEHGNGQLQKSYEMLQTMFQIVPKVFVAQSIRPVHHLRNCRRTGNAPIVASARISLRKSINLGRNLP